MGVDVRGRFSNRFCSTGRRQSLRCRGCVCCRLRKDGGSGSMELSCDYLRNRRSDVPMSLADGGVVICTCLGLFPLRRCEANRRSDLDALLRLPMGVACDICVTSGKVPPIATVLLSFQAPLPARVTELVALCESVVAANITLRSYSNVCSLFRKVLH
jgi:hypothetical protein